MTLGLNHLAEGRYTTTFSITTLGIKVRLHWQCLLEKISVKVAPYILAFATLRDAERIISICQWKYKFVNIITKLNLNIGATTLSITTLSIKASFATISIMTFRIVTFSLTTLNIPTLCHYSECHILIIVMLSVIMISVIMLCRIFHILVS